MNVEITPKMLFKVLKDCRISDFMDLRQPLTDKKVNKILDDLRAMQNLEYDFGKLELLYNNNQENDVSYFSNYTEQEELFYDIAETVDENLSLFVGESYQSYCVKVYLKNLADEVFEKLKLQEK